MTLETETGALRQHSRRLVRELGLLNETLANTDLPPSAVHALIEIGARGTATASELGELLLLEKSSVSRMLSKLVERGELAVTGDEIDGRIRRLSLTSRGRKTLRGIEKYAAAQVQGALSPLSAAARACILAGLSTYARALSDFRTGGSLNGSPQIKIDRGFHPGVIGRAVEMQAAFYNRTVGFGRSFEAKIAAEMAEFSARLVRPGNELWRASLAGAIVGIIAIDGEDLGPGLAHLRWFIVDDGVRGLGIGQALIKAAAEFCDAAGVRETHLWTFRGLDAARHLYESCGFVLREEKPGDQWGTEVIEQHFVRVLRGCP